VILSAKEAGRLGPKFIQEINLEMKKNGISGALTAGSPSKQLDSGFIFKTRISRIKLLAGSYPDQVA